MRFAGSRLLAAGGMGAGGAVLADALTHDSTDRAVDTFQGFVGAYDNADDPFKKVFSAVFLQDGMTPQDRTIAAQVLAGNRTPEVAGLSPAGMQAVEIAYQVQAAAPDLAIRAAALAAQGDQMRQEMGRAGLESSAQAQAAIDQGAGVSPWPAVAGGLAFGGLGAALPIGGRGPHQARR